MARLEEHHERTLKRRMLRRLPDCFYTEDDYEHIETTTLLPRCKIDEWAEKFRSSIAETQQREEYLKDTRNEKRYTLGANMASLESLQAVTSPRAGSSEVKIKFLVATLLPEYKAARCYVEFEDHVPQSSLITRFEEAGMKCDFSLAIENNVFGAQKALDTVRRIIALEDYGMTPDFVFGRPTKGTIMDAEWGWLAECDDTAPAPSELDIKNRQIEMLEIKLSHWKEMAMYNHELANQMETRGDKLDKLVVELEQDNQGLRAAIVANATLNTAMKEMHATGTRVVQKAGDLAAMQLEESNRRREERVLKRQRIAAMEENSDNE
jgi:hypothetical protein